MSAPAYEQERRSLLFDVHKVFRGPCELTQPQRGVLSILCDYGCNTTGYHPSITALEVACAFPRRTITRLLDELERGGWIRRVRNPPFATEYIIAVERITSLAKEYLDAPKAHNRKRAARDGGSLVDDRDGGSLGTEDPQSRDGGSLEQGQRIPSARDPGSPERPDKTKKTKEGQTARARGAGGPPSGVVRRQPESSTDPMAPAWLESFALPALDSEDGAEVGRFLAFYADKVLRKPKAAWSKWRASEHFSSNSGPDQNHFYSRLDEERREKGRELSDALAARQKALQGYKLFGFVPDELLADLPLEIQQEITEKQNRERRRKGQVEFQRDPGALAEIIRKQKLFQAEAEEAQARGDVSDI